MRFDPDEPSDSDTSMRLHSQAANAKAQYLARAALGMEPQSTSDLPPKKSLDEILDRLTSAGPAERVRIIQIVDAVARAYGSTIADLKSKRRTKLLVRARQHAFYLIYTYLDHVSMPMIANFFGLDHSTIHHGINAHMKREEALL